tara:strand:- start:1018 stop:1908 length:891 start_codon:yes stop_codon:yes gene_type:complete
MTPLRARLSRRQKNDFHFFMTVIVSREKMDKCAGCQTMKLIGMRAGFYWEGKEECDDVLFVCTECLEEKHGPICFDCLGSKRDEPIMSLKFHYVIECAGIKAKARAKAKAEAHAKAKAEAEAKAKAEAKARNDKRDARAIRRAKIKQNPNYCEVCDNEEIEDLCYCKDRCENCKIHYEDCDCDSEPETFYCDIHEDEPLTYNDDDGWNCEECEDCKWCVNGCKRPLIPVGCIGENHEEAYECETCEFMCDNHPEEQLVWCKRLGWDCMICQAPKNRCEDCQAYKEDCDCDSDSDDE